jgi:hypothetical protein
MKQPNADSKILKKINKMSNRMERKRNLFTAINQNITTEQFVDNHLLRTYSGMKLKKSLYVSFPENYVPTTYDLDIISRYFPQCQIIIVNDQIHLIRHVPIANFYEVNLWPLFGDRIPPTNPKKIRQYIRKYNYTPFTINKQDSIHELQPTDHILLNNIHVSQPVHHTSDKYTHELQPTDHILLNNIHELHLPSHVLLNDINKPRPPDHVLLNDINKPRPPNHVLLNDINKLHLPSHVLLNDINKPRPPNHVLLNDIHKSFSARCAEYSLYDNRTVYEYSGKLQNELMETSLR